MGKPSDTAPEQPAKSVAENTTDTPKDSAPPAVPASPSADTRGGAGTSTAEGPSHPKVAVKPAGEGKDHEKQGAKSEAEVPPPGERVDDESEGRDDKRMNRQE